MMGAGGFIPNWDYFNGDDLMDDDDIYDVNPIMVHLRDILSDDDLITDEVLLGFPNDIDEDDEHDEDYDAADDVASEDDSSLDTLYEELDEINDSAVSVADLEESDNLEEYDSSEYDERDLDFTLNSDHNDD